MNRRTFIQLAGIPLTGAAVGSGRQLATQSKSDRWRTFEMKTQVEVLRPSGTTRVWLPKTLIRKTAFQRPLAEELIAEGGTTHTVANTEDALGIIVAEFPAGVRPVLTLTSRVATRNYAVDLNTSSHNAPVPRAELEHFLRPTRLQPANGIVKQTADEITRGARTDLDKARAIYEWIVDNTFRDPKVRG